MPTFHQLSLSGGDLDLDVTINGFPVHEGKLDGSSSMPLNPFLIGKGNELRFVIKHRGREAQLEGALQTLKPGDMADTTAAGDFKLPDAGAPQEFTHRFDSDMAPFSKVLQSAKPASAAEILPLAITIRDALRKRNKGPVLKVLTPKLEVLSQAFEAPVDTIRNDVQGFLEELYDSDLAFETSDLEVISHCNGKVHNLRRKDGKPLIRREVEDGSISMAIFAALLPDGPAVVA